MLTLQNSIVAKQHGWRQLLYRWASPTISVGGNLSDDASCNFFSEPSDLNDIEDNLGPLVDNGGLTQTHLPQTGSLAIDTACAGRY